MLHELVFVLLGYPGDVFIPYPSNASTTFAIPVDFPLLHSTERECLNRLGQLGWIYLQIHQFVTSIKKNKKTTGKPHGAYIQALITCIEQTLNEYRNDILDMEKRILNKEDEAGAGVVPLTLLIANLNRWELLLPALWNFIQLLEKNPTKYHGCRLFELLLDQLRTGIFEFRTQVEKMMVHLYDVLYRQLTSWMVYGQCVDPDDEFFIVPYIPQREANTTAWNRLYIVDYARVPSHLSRTLVDSILFVGKAIATVNEMDKLPVSISRHEGDSLLPFQTTRSKRIHQTRLPMQLQQQQQRITIPTDMRKRHLDLLLSLHSSSFSKSNQWIQYPQQLQSVVNQVRKSTADWLFSQVLVGEHGLQRYLSSFRNVFLLSFGDLTTNFINECVSWRKRSLQFNDNRTRSNSADRSSTKTTMIFRYQEINALMGKASMNTEAEDQLAGFSLLVEDDKLQRYTFSDLLLFDFRVILTFDLEWPIDLFLNKSDLKNYSHLWSFLISLKSTQMALNNLWKTLKTNQDTTYSVEAEGNEGYYERCVWRLRASMLFWIETMWNHLQYQVIESHYQKLIETLSANSTSNNKRQSWHMKDKIDFEEIQTAHQDFLGNIMRGCFLKSSDCVETMHGILQTCLDFCALMERLSKDGEWQRQKKRKTKVKTASEIVNHWIKAEVVLTWTEDVNNIQEKFNALIERFFILASTQHPEVKSSGQIDILLLQLDYNKWFSKKPAP